MNSTPADPRFDIPSGRLLILSLLALLPLLAWTGCKSIQASSSRDPDADFARYRTYGFKEPMAKGDPIYFSSTNQELVRLAVAALVSGPSKMAMKGCFLIRWVIR